MGFLDSLLKPRVSLKEAAENAPEVMGCYKVYMNGELKYVGKSGYSLKQRFIQYYDGKMLLSAAGKRIHDNRDAVEVSWVVMISKNECERLEQQWKSRLRPEWNGL